LSEIALFVDDYDIAASSGLTRVVHPGLKRPEPVISADRPWEDMLRIGGTVRKEDDLYRMWYQSYSKETQYINLYAESDDGLVWRKPSLGRCEDFNGALDNNIYLNRVSMRSTARGPLTVTQDHNQNVLHTPHLGPEKTYTMLAYEYGRSSYGPYDGYYLAYSKDGIHWTDGPVEPVIPGHADVGWFTFDERDRLFRGIVKTFLNVRGHSRRSVLWTESADALEWSMPRPAIIPDETDDAWGGGDPDRYTQFYGMPIFRYGPALVGFLQDFRCTDGTVSTDGYMDVQLVTSRDGRTWERTGDRTPIIGLGGDDDWDCGMVYTGNSFIEDGDDLRVYYWGSDSSHVGTTRDGSKETSSIGLATWRRDRLSGLRAGSGGGELRMKPRAIGPELHVNADASGGSVVAGVYVHGRPVPDMDISDCVPLTQDSLDHVFRWRGKTLAPVEGREIVLRFANAEVFSVW
jgi:hypothetical protein